MKFEKKTKVKLKFWGTQNPEPREDRAYFKNHSC